MGNLYECVYAFTYIKVVQPSVRITVVQQSSIGHHDAVHIVLLDGTICAVTDTVSRTILGDTYQLQYDPVHLFTRHSVGRVVTAAC
jgi:hypothetical protein